MMTQRLLEEKWVEWDERVSEIQEMDFVLSLQKHESTLAIDR
jgi:hypothetical protein